MRNENNVTQFRQRGTHQTLMKTKPFHAFQINSLAFGGPFLKVFFVIIDTSMTRHSIPYINGKKKRSSTDILLQKYSFLKIQKLWSGNYG